MFLYAADPLDSCGPKDPDEKAVWIDSSTYRYKPMTDDARADVEMKVFYGEGTVMMATMVTKAMANSLKQRGIATID